MDSIIVDGEEVRMGTTPPYLSVLQDGEWVEVPLEPDMARSFRSSYSHTSREIYARFALRQWRSWLWRERARFSWPARYDDWTSRYEDGAIVLAVDGSTEIRIDENGRPERYVGGELTVLDLADLQETFYDAFRRRDVECLAQVLRVVVPRQPPTFRQQLGPLGGPLGGPFEELRLMEREVGGRYRSGCLVGRLQTDQGAVLLTLAPDDLASTLLIRGMRQEVVLGEYALLYRQAARRYDLGELLSTLYRVALVQVAAFVRDRCPQCRQYPGTVEIDGRRYCEHCVVSCVGGHPLVAAVSRRCYQCRRHMCQWHEYHCDHCGHSYCPEHYNPSRRRCQECLAYHHLDNEEVRAFSPLEGFDGPPRLEGIRAQLPLAPPRGWTGIEVVDQPGRIVVRATSAVPTLEDYDHFPLQPFVVTLVWAATEEGDTLTTADRSPCDGLLHIAGPHPHLSGGEPCWGNLGAPWHIAKESQEVDVMLTVVFDFLSSYNPNSAYQKMERIAEYAQRWEERFPGMCHFCARLFTADDEYETFDDALCCADCLGVCAACGDRRPNDWLYCCCWVSGCDTLLCGNCARFCCRCDNPTCAEHTTACPACGSSLCDRHATACHCGHVMDTAGTTLTTEELPY